MRVKEPTLLTLVCFNPTVSQSSASALATRSTVAMYVLYASGPILCFSRLSNSLSFHKAAFRFSSSEASSTSSTSPPNIFSIVLRNWACSISKSRIKLLRTCWYLKSMLAELLLFTPCTPCKPIRTRGMTERINPGSSKPDIIVSQKVLIFILCVVFIWKCTIDFAAIVRLVMAADCLLFKPSKSNVHDIESSFKSHTPLIFSRMIYEQGCHADFNTAASCPTGLHYAYCVSFCQGMYR